VKVFVDTSAFFALLTGSDRRHGEAARIWAGLIEAGAEMETHNYVVVETVALVQRRLGAKATAAFFDAILGVVRIHWIDEDIHRRAEGAFRMAGRKTLSLVDCTSFEIMRGRSIGTAFAFDAHFEENGFAVLKP
jgi:predicted nucleic acid-binding protein